MLPHNFVSHSAGASKEDQGSFWSVWLRVQQHCGRPVSDAVLSRCSASESVVVTRMSLFSVGKIIITNSFHMMVIWNIPSGLTQCLFCREISTIIYSLDCFPTQADLHDFIAQVRNSLCLYVVDVYQHIMCLLFVLFPFFDDSLQDKIKMCAINMWPQLLWHKIHRFCYFEHSESCIFILFNQVEEDHSGFIHMDKFLPAMMRVLLENKYDSRASCCLVTA